MTGEEYNIVEEENINHIPYRIILYDDGYYSLQIKPSNNQEYIDYVISPKKSETGLDESEYLIDYVNGGYGDLKYILNSIYESDRLQKGDYWELQLSLQTSDNVMEELSEIITRNDGEKLIKKVEGFVELMKDAELYSEENEIDIFSEFFKVICYCITIACFLLLLLKVTGMVG